MSGRERLDRGDARDDVVIDVGAGGDGVEDSQRAVVERRVAPRQEGADAAGRQLGSDRLGPHLGSGGVPVGDRLPVGGAVRGGPGPWRVGQFDETVAGLADEPLADLAPQFDEVILGRVLVGGFVHREEHLGVVERRHRLCRHIVRIAGADADHVNPPNHAGEYAA